MAAVAAIATLTAGAGLDAYIQCKFRIQSFSVDLYGEGLQPKSRKQKLVDLRSNYDVIDTAAGMDEFGPCASFLFLFFSFLFFCFFFFFFFGWGITKDIVWKSLYIVAKLQLIPVDIPYSTTYDGDGDDGKNRADDTPKRDVVLVLRYCFNVHVYNVHSYC